MENIVASTLIHNIGELVSLSPLAQQGKVAQITDADLGRIPHAWLRLKDGKVAGFGQGEAPEAAAKAATLVYDARGGLVIPGLVDAHTHPIFAGNRSHEFAQRLNGSTYQQIAAAGGGIRYTVRQTRAADDASLAKALHQRLQRMLRLGTTTLECKTGYGLTVAEELRLLRLLQAAKATTPQSLFVTCLALHAYVAEDGGDRASFLRAMSDDLLPQMAAGRLADACDAFVEQGYFSFEDCHPYFSAAKRLGLGIRIHADEFADSGTALAAAGIGAMSADHLEHASDAGIAAMAKAGVVAVLLPGTSLYTRLPFADARRFTERGCPVALATDFNPGSCVLDNLAQVATLGALYCHLSPAATMAAVTYVPAYSLGWHRHKGALAVGFDADVLYYEGMTRLEDWLADFGRHAPSQVWAKGQGV